MEGGPNFFANFTRLVATPLQSDQTYHANGVSIRLRHSDGYISSASLGASLGVPWTNYARSNQAKSLIAHLREQLRRTGGPSEPVVKGSSAYRIYWVHPLVALDYIGTVSVELKLRFLVWLVLLLNRESVSLDDRSDVAAVQEQLNSAVAQLQTAREKTAELEIAVATHKAELVAKDAVLAQREHELGKLRYQLQQQRSR